MSGKGVTAFLAERGAKYLAPSGREFDERIALPNGRDAPIDLGSAANAF